MPAHRIDRTECRTCGLPLNGSHKVYCKACFAAYRREWAKKNPEKVARAAAKWEAANPGGKAASSRKRYREDPERFAANKRRWVEADPARYSSMRKRSHIKSQYGITHDQYLQILEDQGGLCPICGVVLTTGRGAAGAAIDHDHDTGKVRGVPCSNCNTAIGYLADDPDRALALAAYLLRSTPIVNEGEEPVVTPER